MTDETITIPKLTAQILFDALVQSMDFGSGMLDNEEVDAMRALAVAIGVDPNTATPGELKRQYPHPFDGETDRLRVGYIVGATRQASCWTGTAWDFKTVIDETKAHLMPDHVPCKVGTWGRWCLKPESDPIHQTAEMGA